MRAVEVFDLESDYYTGPPVTSELIRAAEVSLGVRLPVSYVALLGERNGGALLRRCFPTSFASSWAPDHIGVDAIVGVGGKWGIDSEDLGSRYLIGEWGYPDVGVVFCSTPSGGHEAVDPVRWTCATTRCTSASSRHCPGPTRSASPPCSAQDRRLHRRAHRRLPDRPPLPPPRPTHHHRHLRRVLGLPGRRSRRRHDRQPPPGGTAGEFPGIRTRAEFQQMIEDVMTNADEVRNLSGGRTAYWKRGTVVIENPGAVDGGTVFVPTNGYAYFQGLT